MFPNWRVRRLLPQQRSGRLPGDSLSAMGVYPRCSPDAWSYWCSNERNWLIALNTFVMVSGAVLAGAAIALTYSATASQNGENNSEEGDRTVYDTWLALSVMGAFQTIVAVVGIIAADKVSLQLMVVNFWLTALVMVVIFIFVVMAFDFQYSFAIWISQHWSDDGLLSWRKQFCREGTYDNLCKVPKAGFPYADQTAWCVARYDSTECEAVRREALDTANVYIELWMNVAGTIAVSSVLEMMFSLYLTIRVVTVPIIMMSAKSMINYLMIFPAVGTSIMGYYVGLYDDEYGQLRWVDDMFFAAGGLLLATAFLGVVAGAVKHLRLLQAYLLGLGLVLLMYIMMVISAFYLVGTLEILGQEKSTAEIGADACRLQLYGCCCCSNATMYENYDEIFVEYDIPACPEYTTEEVVDYGLAFIKISAIMTLPAMAFVVAALTGGLVLHNNLKSYQCDYI